METRVTEHIYEGALRKLIAEQSGDNKTLLHDFSTAFFSSIQQGLLENGHIRLHNFGSYQLKWSKQRKGRHPQTGEALIIPAQPRIVFTPAKHLKEQVNLLNTAQSENTTLLTTMAETAQAVEAVEATKIPTDKESHYHENKIATKTDEFTSVAPYLIKNLPVRKKIEEKRIPLKSIAAAMILGLLVFYAFQSGDTSSTRAITHSIDIVSATSAQQQDAIYANNVTAQIEPQTDNIDSSLTDSNDDTPSGASATPALQAQNTSAPDELHSEPATNLITENKISVDEIFFKARNHKLIDGDSLWRLSKKNYINPLYWPHIYQANKYVIKNPNKLYIGKTIELPDLLGNPEQLSPIDRRNIAEGYFLLYLHHKKTGKNLPYFALLGAARFDPSVIREHDFEIAEEDWENLHIVSN
jgi:nucleoid DNA-binding protein